LQVTRFFFFKGIYKSTKLGFWFWKQRIYCFYREIPAWGSYKILQDFTGSYKKSL